MRKDNESQHNRNRTLERRIEQMEADHDEKVIVTIDWRLFQSKYNKKEICGTVCDSNLTKKQQQYLEINIRLVSISYVSRSKFEYD